MYALRDEDSKPVAERSNDKRLLRDLGLGTASLEREADVELDTRTPSHLRHAMSSVHDVEDLLHVGLAMQRGVQRRVADACSELSMCKDVCVSPDGARKVRVDGARETVVPERIARDAPRAEILCGKHAPRRHDANQCVERGLVWILPHAVLIVGHRDKEEEDEQCTCPMTPPNCPSSTHLKSCRGASAGLPAISRSWSLEAASVDYVLSEHLGQTRLSMRPTEARQSAGRFPDSWPRR